MSTRGPNIERLKLPDTDKALPKAIVNGYLRYQKFRSFAEGGAAKIELCLDRNLGREVLMKRLHSDGAADDVEQMRFLREARVTALIQHPNTVPVYELSRDDRRNLYFTMKHVEGEDLREIIEGQVAGKWEFIDEYTLDRLLVVLVQVCNCIAFAHSRGVIHRDLKPANILVGAFGEVMILDWGIAKVEDAKDPADSLHDAHIEPHLTNHGSRIGTPLYMSPEQAAGEEVDERSDIYSIGAILYEVLTRRNLVFGKDQQEVLRKIQEEDPVPPRMRAPEYEISPELEAICMKAIARNPDDRYQDLAVMTEDIRAALRGDPVSVLAYGPMAKFWLWRREHVLSTTSILSFALGAIAAAIILYLLKA